MGLKILCSGYLIRYPLGGMTFHHLQYLLGFKRLGHQVVYFEDFGWDDSCYDAGKNEMTGDPGYGIWYFEDCLQEFSPVDGWCFLAEDGKAHGMSRDELARHCEESDVYFNLSNINWIPELETCKRRILVDTDPVFTQIGGHGSGGDFGNYKQLFTYGENINRANCTIPNSTARWQPTRQPVVLDLWNVTKGDQNAALTTVMSWTAYGDKTFEGRSFGQKNIEFAPFFDFPRQTSADFEIALASIPEDEKQRLIDGNWNITSALESSISPSRYQEYLRNSRGEFSVAKHAYVTTNSGWFSDRSAGYMASGRPVIVQDTGFSKNLPCGEGLLPFKNKAEAIEAVKAISNDYDKHCDAARGIVEEYFDSDKVLSDLLEKSL